MDYKAWHSIKNAKLTSVEGSTLTQDPDGTVQASGSNPKQDDYQITFKAPEYRLTGLKLEVLPNASHTKGGLSRGASGEFILTDIKVQVRRKGSTQVRDIVVDFAIANRMGDQKDARSYGDIKGVLDDDPRNGWTTRGHNPKDTYFAVFALADPLSLEKDEEITLELRQRSTDGDANIGRFRVYACSEPGPAVRSIDKTPLEQWSEIKGDPSPTLLGLLKDEFLTTHEPYQRAKASLDRAVRQLQEIQAVEKKVDVMVMAERPQPRPTHILIRGVWDKKGDVVVPGVPSSIATWSDLSSKPRTRLDLAKWIVSRDNPLTARVVVNHVWQLLFGAGLVRTVEDFGLQGEHPLHPELLDWLAVDFMEHGWDIKRLVKQIVTSDTYQQDSKISPELLTRDPENRLHARGARFRLPSWMLRDAALQASGLLNPAIGGPPIRPFQPEGVWEEMFMGRFKYEPSEGPSQYRRTVYAFWRRAISPTFLFDSAQRRVCEVRQNRTNTPLHALTLLNDTNYLVAARSLAEHCIQTSPDRSARIQELMRRVVSRAPSAHELTILEREYARAFDYFKADPKQSARYLTQAAPQATIDSDPNPDLAACTLVASLILNLDESVTHE
jgi:hypothetical protein